MTPPLTPKWDDRCDSCSEPIEWAVTSKLGKKMPLDVGFFGDGTIVVIGTAPGGMPLVLIVSKADLDLAREHGTIQLRRSHFATCPDAPTWRRPRPKKEET